MVFFQKDPVEQFVKALRQGNLTVVRDVLKKNPAAADQVIDLGPKEGCTTPLHIAIQESQAELVKFLVGELGVQIKDRFDKRVVAESRHLENPTDASRNVCKALDDAQHAKYQLELPSSKIFKGKA